MQALINFLSGIYAIELITIGENVITLGQTIAGALFFSLAISVFKKIKL